MEELQTIKYVTNNVELNIKIDYEEETVWLTTDQIAILFDKTKQNISKHLNNIFKNNEANEYSVVNFYLTTATDRKTYNIKHYNLEIVILIGNKIDQKKTSEFKEYILDIIKEYKKAHKRYEIVKFIDKTFEIDVNIDPDEETVWLTLEDISRLFDRDRSVIGKHIKKIYRENELEENRTRAKNARHLPDGRQYYVDIYNLDIILSVGYRVNSKRGTMFRKWANKILKQYLMKGYAINSDRVTVTKRNFQNLINDINVIKTKQNISKHLNNIFNNNEANEDSTVNFYLTVASNNKTYNIKHYNLEIVILIGNKIDQKKTSKFKEYILDIIKEYKKVHKRYEIVKFIDKTFEIDVNIDPDEETVWLTQKEIAELFEKDRKTISRHINNIFEEFELMENSVCSKKEHTGLDGKEYIVNI